MLKTYMHERKLIYFLYLKNKKMELGKGVFSKVYLKDGNAYKEIYPENEKYFKREIEFLGKMSNVNIIRMLSFVKEERIIVLELCEKAMNKLEYNQISDLNSRSNYFQILNGIKHIHLKNICHFDIKPDNILIKGNILKICDFGLSRYMDDEKNVDFEDVGGIASCNIPIDIYDFKRKEIISFIYNGIRLDILGFFSIVYFIRNKNYVFLNEHKKERDYLDELFEDDLIFKIYECRNLFDCKMNIIDFFEEK
jgi:serine/threonine protein kinase